MDGAFHRAKGVARAHLQRFAGDEGDDELKDDHAHEDHAAHKAGGIHPGAEALRLPHELDHRLAHQIADRGDEEKRHDDGEKVYLLFVRLGQLRPFAFAFHTLSPSNRAAPKGAHV